MYVKEMLISGAIPKLQIPYATATWDQCLPSARAYAKYHAPAHWNGMNGKKQ